MCTIVALYSSAQQSFKVNYTLPIEQSSVVGLDTAYHAKVTYDIWASSLDEIINAIKQGDIKIYDGNNKLISFKNAIDSLYPPDDIDYSIQPDPVKRVLDTIYLKSEESVNKIPDCITGFRMNEIWEIKDNGMIEKKISKYAPLCSFLDDYNSIDTIGGAIFIGRHRKNLKPVFWIYPVQVSGPAQSVNVEYSLDLRQFENQQDSATFVNLMVGKLLSGHSSAYTCAIPELGEKQRLLSKAEIEDLLKPGRQKDTMLGADLVTGNSHTGIDSFAKTTVIDRIKFRERWTIDGRGNFSKSLKEYVLGKADYDRHGHYRGSMSFIVVRNTGE